LVIGHWSLVIGHWSFVICHLLFDSVELRPMLDEQLLIITEWGARMSSKKFQELQVYRLAEQLTDERMTNDE
jgi:hypothetical protein